MALADALKPLNKGPGEGYGYISREDLVEVITTIYADRLPGPEGPAGARGEQGFTGSTGPSGAQGEQGVRGPLGKQGKAGPAGVATVTLAQGGAFGTAGTATLDPTTHELTLTLPEGPTGPVGGSTPLKGTINEATAAPAAPADGDLYMVAGVPPAWAPPAESGDLIVYTTTGNRWVNIGGVNTWRVSTTAGNTIWPDADGKLLHRDTDHASLVGREEFMNLMTNLQDQIHNAVPISGGQLNGHLTSPPVSPQDPGNTLITREYVHGHFLGSTGTQAMNGDMAVSGMLRAHELTVVLPVRNLKVEPATTAQGVLNLNQAQALFAQKTHTHSDALTAKTGIAAVGGELTGELKIAATAKVSTPITSLFGGPSLIWAPSTKAGDPDMEFAVFFDKPRGLWTYSAPASGISTVLFQSPPTCYSEPGLPEQLANRQYVDSAAASAQGAAQVRGDEQVQDLRMELVAEINALKDEIVILKEAIELLKKHKP